MKRDGVVAGKLDAQRMRARAAYKTCTYMYDEARTQFLLVYMRTSADDFFCFLVLCVREYKNKTI